MDTYGTLPFSLFKDERLDGAPLIERLFAAVIKALSNDINLVEGDSVGFAQLIGADPADVAPLMEALEQREFIDRFTAAGAEYMRRSTSARVEPPGPHWARITAPDAERVDAAAAGYVEGLVG